jgi:RND superfamily putative drug exporter
MFEKLGHFAVRRKKFAVIAFVISILVAGGVGAQVFNRLDSGGYSIA